MKIAVHDANIIFDIIDGGFADLWFALGIETHTTELILAEIQEKHQREVIDTYVRAEKLIVDSFDNLSDIVELHDTTTGLSIQDCSILYLSERIGAMLLTGDNRLRKVADNRNIEVHGTLWMLDRLIEANLLNPIPAIEKLLKLLEINPRLPQAECQKRINKWQNTQ